MVKGIESKATLKEELRALRARSEASEQEAAATLARLEHLNGVLRAIRDVNQLIVREKDRQELIEEACKILVGTRGFLSAWIVAPAGKHHDLLAAGAGQVQADFDAFVTLWRAGKMPSCCEEMGGNGQVKAIENPREACADCPLAVEQDYPIALLSPIRHGQRLYGYLEVAAPRDFACDLEEQRLVAEVAGDLALALHSIDEEEERRHVEHMLQERIKEKSCLYAVSELAQQAEGSIEELLSAVPALLPAGWQYPAITAVCIRYQGRSYCSPNYRKSPWRQEAPLDPADASGGSIEVCYLQERPQADEGPFLKEERDMLTAIAAQLSSGLDRVAALTQVQESELRFRTYFEESIIGMAITSPEKGWLQSNRALREMLGFSAEELHRSTWADLTHPEDLEADLAYFDRLLAGEIDGYQLQKRFIRKDGTALPTILSVKAVRKAAGEVEYVLAQLQDLSAEKETEAAMQRQRNQLLAILDGIEDVIYVADPESYDLVHVNQAFLEAWGGDVIGKKCYRVLQGRDTPCPFCTNDKIFHEFLGESYVWEFQNEKTKCWYRCADKAIAWPDGRMLRFELASDITALKATEEALKQSREQYQLALDGANDGIFDWDIPSGEVYFSPRWKSMLGYSEEEVEGRVSAWEELLHPEDYQTVMQALEEHLSGKQPEYEVEFRARHKDGSYRWILARGTALRNESGEAYRMAGSHTDITERREVEDQLAQYTSELAVRNMIAEVFLKVSGEELYTKVLGVVLEVMASPFGVFGYIDDNGDLVVPTMTRTIWDQCQVPDKDIVFPKESWGDSTWPTALREKRIICVNEASTRVPKGHIPISRNVAMPLLYQNRVVGLLQVANKESDYTSDDLAVFKSIGAMVAPVLAARLERERQEARIQAILAELKRSNQELEQFAYVASHDLQEPLRMVSSYTQLLAERYAHDLDEKAHKYINYAVDGATRMQRLINDLLSFSRVTTKGAVFEEVDSHQALGVAIANLQGAIQEQGALVFNDTLPHVQGDTTQLAQLFQNLIGNAIKFRGEVSPHVYIAAKEEGKMWRFSIQDNGIGIDPKHADRIFVIFQRLHSRSDYPGTGIGLALCKRIVERHGGRIWVEGTQGGGSTFFFTLAKSTTEGHENGWTRERETD